MPLSWNEIKTRAIKFSKEWEAETKENAEAKSFWDEFFNIFGNTRKSVALFEHAVKKLGNKQGFIDLFWPGKLIVEHKSKGKDLGAALQQAIDYALGLDETERPQFIVISDFATFRFYDLAENKHTEFNLINLHKNVELFGFIAGYQKISIRDEDPINIKAAEKMGKLHDLLKENGYEGHDLEIYLVRLLFMLFADDTNIFNNNILWDFIENHTAKDGSDLAPKLAQLFQVLNTPQAKRLKNLDEIYAQFPYINGKLFEENLSFASFDSQMRKILLESCAMDWSLISPAIFGSLFQSIMDKTARRNLGAHYTSEKNILKLIKPLFLDELWAKFEKAKGNSKQLAEFHKSLGELKFFDPACGSGNFLIIAYRELRKLELAILEQTYKDSKVLSIEQVIWIDIDQFYGIEIDEWAARIAEVAMWLIDHQMNMQISEKFGSYFVRIPLKKSVNILNANSLQTDWQSLIPKNELSYILGNPPFIGSNIMNKKQRSEIVAVFDNIRGAGILDYVTGWYIKAAKFIKDTKIKAAFVSTNSITQGEQTSVLWSEMLNKYNIKIQYAHRTFKWNNEAKGNAAVYCVIVGFADFDTKIKTIFDYEDIKGEPTAIPAKNINPYLVDAPNLLVTKQTKPICKVPNMLKGNYYAKSKGLIVEQEDLNFLIANEPKSKKYIKKLIGANEFINNKKRYCLWLVDCPPQELKNMPLVMERVRSVKEERLTSSDKGIQKIAFTPTVFRETNNPDSCLVIPVVSSENRSYIPMGFIDKNTISTNGNLIIPNATIFHFGILTSEMHMTWVKYTCGRLKSDYRYSKNIVYNNYPFPKDINDKQKERVEKAAQAVLDMREKYPDSSLADLYDPLAMPPDLVKAHKALDKAVDLCYRPQAFTNERSRIEFLFDLYSEYVAPLQAELHKQKKNKTKKVVTL